MKLAAFLAIVAATIFFYHYAGDVQFEDDLNRINYFPAEMQRAQDIIVGSSDRESVFVLSSGKSLGEAVAGMGNMPFADRSRNSADRSRNSADRSWNSADRSWNSADRSWNSADRSRNSADGSRNSVDDSWTTTLGLDASGPEVKVTALTDIILTPEQLQASIAAWNRHVGRAAIHRVSGNRASGNRVTGNRVTGQGDAVNRVSTTGGLGNGDAINRVSTIRTIGEKQGFKPSFFDAYEDLFQPIELNAEAFYRDFILNDGLFRELVFTGDDGYTVVSTVNLPKAEKAAFKDLIEQNAPQLEVVARSSLALDLVNTVSEDLNFMLLLSGGLVFVILLLTYGRIELTIITFLPMVVSWVWILGICGLTGIKFNMVNVLITTFVFGLGDDYSIFISDGILSRYKYGLDKLKSFRGSIILSAATTIIGTGVLIFSKHPALNSIAVLSVTGMVCVLVAALTLQPLLYEVMIESRKKRGFSPLELRDLLRAALAFGWFFIGCIILTAILFILMPLPLSKRRKQRIMMPLISALIKSDVDIMTHAKQRWINKQPLDKPAILIANHASFVDLMLMIGSSNKLLLVTNDWVWNSPLFGFFIRYVEYIHAKDETSWDLDNIRKKVDEGYSILIFPEGTRSLDGRIGRFKKGAFYLAEQLQMDIQPVILHGIHHALRKGDFSVQKSLMTIKYLPRIAADDPAFGTGYRERTKAIAKHFKAEFEQVREEVETPDFFADKVQRLYTYKGPVLEWYVRIKMMLERNFSAIVQHVPKEGKVYDLGCGYGYLTHLLAMQSYKRHVIGLDYDEEKVQVAANTHYRGGNLSFAQSDLTQFMPEAADCFIIKDVLHYFPAAEQEALLKRCGEKLNAGGTIIIRDGIEDEKQKHGVTRMTEVFSTRIFGFNKTEHKLEFLPESRILSFAQQFNLSVERLDNKASSNVTFVLRK